LTGEGADKHKEKAYFSIGNHHLVVLCSFSWFQCKKQQSENVASPESFAVKSSSWLDPFGMRWWHVAGFGGLKKFAERDESESQSSGVSPKSGDVCVSNLKSE
jgi:hypothetical protein